MTQKQNSVTPLILLSIIINLGCHGSVASPGCQQVDYMPVMAHTHNTSSHTRTLAASSSTTSATRMDLKITFEFAESIRKKWNFADLEREVRRAGIELQSMLKVRHPLTKNEILPRVCKESQKSLIKSPQNDEEMLTVCLKGCETDAFCNKVVIPTKYLQKCYYYDTERNLKTNGSDGTGIGRAELILLVTHEQDRCRAGAYAWASACYLEDFFDRPIMAIINICNEFDSLRSAETRHAILIHEMLHNLAFTPQLYAFFRDSQGKPRTSRNPTTNLPNQGNLVDIPNLLKPAANTLQAYYRPYNSRIGEFEQLTYVLVTPRVQKEVRQHFNCSKAEGLYLEEFEISISHSKNLYFSNSLMNMFPSNQMQITRIELALLEDSGWYIPDYSKAKPYYYARNSGCGFIGHSCYDYMRANEQRSQPYCQSERLPDGRTFRCNSNHVGIETCQITEHARELPEQYQYFPDAQLGGHFEYEYFCPRFGTNLHGVNCKHAHLNFNAKYSTRGYQFGEDSACFDMSSQPRIEENGKSREWDSKYGAICLRVSCPFQLTTSEAASETEHVSRPFKVHVYNKTFECSTAGQEIRVDTSTTINYTIRIQARIVCPSYHAACLHLVTDKHSRQHHSINDKMLLALIAWLTSTLMMI